MNNDLLKVKDAPGLYRDPHSKAIIVGDESALIEHRKKKAMLSGIINKSRALEEQVKTLNDRMSNIEDLLMRLVKQQEK